MSTSGRRCGAGGQPRKTEARGYYALMSVRARLSWILRGSARVEHLERSIDELRNQVAELSSKQDAALADVRDSVSAVLDDVDERMTVLDKRSR